MLVGCAYLFIPDSPLPVLAWFGFVPLLIRLEKIQGFWRFYAEALAMLWIMQLFTLGRVFIIGLGASFFFVTWQALLSSAPFILLWLARRGLGWPRALLGLPFCWTAWEWLYIKQPMQIPTLLGATQADFYPLIQFYDITGIWGGSFLIMLSNVLIVLALIRSRRTGQRRAICYSGMIAAAVLSPPLLYSAWVFSQETNEHSKESVRVAIIQTGNPENLSSHPVTQAIEISETVLAEKPDLLAWPETALERDARSEENRSLWQSIFAWSANRNIPVLTGIIDVATYAHPPPLLLRQGLHDEHFNAAAVITPQLSYYALTLPIARALEIKVYRKRELFPFAERAPFLETFPFLTPLVMHAPDKPPRNLGIGKQPQAFAFFDREGKKRRVGAFICFEILFPHVAADLVRAGAEFLVTVSNDQHLHGNARWVTAAHARIRAIETRRSMARVNTVGHSLFADPYGRIDDRMPLDVAGASIHGMEVRTAKSVYVRWGDWLPLTCAFISLLVLSAALLVLQLKRKSFLHKEATAQKD